MEYFWKIICFCCLVTLCCSCSDSENEPNAPDPNGYRTNPQLSELWDKIKVRESSVESRDIFSFLLEAAACNWDQTKLKSAILFAQDMQHRDPNHRYYGNFLTVQGPEPSDPDQNAVQFCMENGILLRMLYWDKLNAENKALLQDIIDLAVIAVRRQDVLVTYTNMYCMKMWNMIAMGETLGIADMASEGYEMLKTWMKYTSKNGIWEHNSPTYSGIAAADLSLIAKYSAREDIRKEASVAIEYFSYTLFANCINQGVYLGGPHSRDYNRLISQGNTDQYMKHYLKGYELSFIKSLSAWEPADEAKNVVNKIPRMVAWRFGELDTQVAYSYYGNKFNIGCMERTWGPDHKVLVANVSSKDNPLVVNTALVVEGRSDPYGDKKLTTGQGIAKARQLTEYLLSCAQKENEVVCVVATDGKERTDTEKLCSHVLIPASKIDGLWDGNSKLEQLDNISSRALSDTKTFFVRFEDVVIGIRFLLAKDVYGRDVPVNLINDNKKVSVGKAMRLTVEHSTSRPSSHGVLGMWWRVKEGLDDTQFAAFRKEMMEAPVTVDVQGDTYTVKVTSPDKGELGVKTKGNNRENQENLAIYGADKLPDGSIFSVDGANAVQRIWNKSSYLK